LTTRHRDLQAAVPAKVCTVLGLKPASIQHDTAKCRGACQLKRAGDSGWGCVIFFMQLSQFLEERIKLSFDHIVMARVPNSALIEPYCV
jgi:hypothetical protein